MLVSYLREGMHLLSRISEFNTYKELNRPKCVPLGIALVDATVDEVDHFGGVSQLGEGDALLRVQQIAPGWYEGFDLVDGSFVSLPEEESYFNRVRRTAEPFTVIHEGHSIRISVRSTQFDGNTLYKQVAEFREVVLEALAEIGKPHPDLHADAHELALLLSVLPRPDSRDRSDDDRNAAAIGESLGVLRSLTGVSLQELGTTVGLQRGAMSHVERGTRTTTLQKASRWAEACGGQITIKPPAAMPVTEADVVYLKLQRVPGRLDAFIHGLIDGIVSSGSPPNFEFDAQDPAVTVELARRVGFNCAAVLAKIQGSRHLSMAFRGEGPVEFEITADDDVPF